MSTDTTPVSLVFDTTNRWIVAGLFGPDLALQISLDAPRESYPRLLPEIQRLLRGSGIRKPDRIVCATGPGSFTGIRITVAAARNLAQLWEIPVQGVDSLVYYGYQSLHRWQKEEEKRALPSSMAVLLDGKQKKVYARLWHDLSSVQRLEEPPIQDLSPAEFLRQVPDSCLLFADDPPAIRALLQEEQKHGGPEVPESHGLIPISPPDAKTLHELALLLDEPGRPRSWNTLTPTYVRTDPAHEKYPEGFKKI